MSDASGSGFGKYVPGFEFLQNLASQAAGGVAQGLGNSLPQLPNLGHWVAPTFNVEELDKRIEELKAVHFWLDQNSKALGATIQALEVQKMTLATLRGMNFSMGEVANALKLKADTMFTGAQKVSEKTAEAAKSFSGAAHAAPKRKPAQKGGKSAQAATASGVVDPLQWWGALTQQFQQIAATAMKDAAAQTSVDAARNVATGVAKEAMKTAAGMAKAATGGGSRTAPRRPARKSGAQ